MSTVVLRAKVKSFYLMYFSASFYPVQVNRGRMQYVDQIKLMPSQLLLELSNDWKTKKNHVH